ncbi:MAG: hypothetical protein KJP00_03425 [Bacteroidia bacterium]|nr:hypothetical protein [Bacteroidia bacterium]
MKKVDQYLDDISSIKEMMEKSSKFLSLSGLSGILAGTYALIGAIAAYHYVFQDSQYQEYKIIIPTRQNLYMILFIASAVILLSLATGYLLSRRKAKKNGYKMWDKQIRRFAVSFMIPLVTGGILCIILVHKGFIGLIAPLTLIFYGLALVNASAFTYSETRWLGIAEIIIGMLAFFNIGYSLVYWAVGFGVLHIIYGAFMYFKYER